MPRLVMKFGGTSVANVERIRNVARHVKREVEAGYEVAVVVSAMSGKTNELVAWCKEASAPLRPARIRRRRRLGRAGDLRAAGHRAAGDGRPGPLLAGLADPDPDLGRARLGPHRRHRRRERSREGFAARRGRGGLGLPGRPQGQRPHHDARPRRLGHQRGGARRGASRPTAATSTPTSTASTPPTRASSPKARRLDKVAFEEMLEMASLGAKVLQVRSVELAMVHRVPTYVRSSFDDPADPQARHPHLRRGGHRGTAGRHRHRLFARTRPRSRCATSPTSPASPRRSSCRWPTPTSMST